MIFKILATLVVVATVSAEPPVLVELFCDIDPGACKWEIHHELVSVYETLKDTGIMNLGINLFGYTCEPIGPGEYPEQRMMACAKHYSTNNATLFDFTSCFMAEDKFSYADVEGKECAEKHGLEWNEIEACYKSEEGIRYLEEEGARFHHMKPPISTFPSFFFDEVFRYQAYGDLLNHVCDAYTGPRPAECP